MEFKIERAALQRGLVLAAGIADRKNTLPILANVLVKTDGRKKVICAATDLHVTLVAELEAKVEKEGGLTLAAKQFVDIVKGLDAEEVLVGRNEQNWAEIRSGRSEFKLVGMIDRDFPKLPDVRDAAMTEVDPAVICEMIGKTIFSVSSDETRTHLSGVFFESNGQRMRMVSTDGHRLSKVERAAAGPALPAGILVPRKGVAELRRIFEGRDGTCGLGVRDGLLIARAGELCLTIKLSESQFPPYEQVIPKEQERKVFVPRDAFLAALRRVSIMASDKTFGIRLQIEKGWLGVQADSPDLGNARERIEIEYKGGGISVGVNARYLIEFLAELDGPEVQIELGGELDPVVLRSSDSADYLGVVMPMRL